MASLEDLLKLNGVAAAGEFTGDGKLVEFKSSGEFSQETAEQTAQFTAAVTQVFEALSSSYTKLNPEFEFHPQHGWAFSGGDWTVAVGAQRGVFVKTAEADYNQLSPRWLASAEAL